MPSLKKHITQAYGRVFGTSSDQLFRKGAPPRALTQTQEMFIEWNAQRLNISVEASKTRYFVSWSALHNGHGGSEFRALNDLSYALFQVFSNDSAAEVYAAYALHAPMHFLRMLSYAEPHWREDDIVVQHLGRCSTVNILDYGCGLAQKSRTLAVYLANKGIAINLYLVDIPTIRKEFLLWWGKKAGISVTFFDCTADVPIPNLPPCDFCIATEFFEHVYDPVRYFDKIHAALRNTGLLETEISDHGDEFMHVSPNLKSVRDRIHELGYEELKQNVIFRKTARES